VILTQASLQNTRSLATVSAIGIYFNETCSPASPVESVDILLCTLSRMPCRKIVLMKDNRKLFLKNKQTNKKRNILSHFFSEFLFSHFIPEELTNAPFLCQLAIEAVSTSLIFSSLHFSTVMDLSSFFPPFFWCKE